MLIGADSGRAIRLGDPIRVQVARVEAPRGRVDLLPVELAPSEAEAAAY
jgi:ribonuclease R